VKDFYSGDALSDHPSSEDLAAYVNGTLAGGGRDNLEEHLVKCRECRHDVTTARRLLRQQRSPNRRLWLVPAVAAAALVLVVLPRLGPLSSREEAVRSGEGAGSSDVAATIKVVAPSNGSTIESRSVVFTWNSEPGQPRYDLSLTDAEGRELWSAQTTDTTLTLPNTVSLDRGRTYFWTVDALTVDGRSLTTRAQRFSTRP
jgi:hypothetical protein